MCLSSCQMDVQERQARAQTRGLEKDTRQHAINQRIVDVVALIDYVCRINEDSTPSKTAIRPTYDLLTTLAASTRAGPELLVTMLAYITRVTEQVDLQYANATHLVLGAFIVAAKFYDDTIGFCPNSDFAVISSSSLSDVNKLERTILSHLDWSLHVDAEEYEDLVSMIEERSYLA